MLIPTTKPPNNEISPTVWVDFSGRTACHLTECAGIREDLVNGIWCRFVIDFLVDEVIHYLVSEGSLEK